MSDHRFGFEVFCFFFFFRVFYFYFVFMTLIPHTSHFSFVGLSVVCCLLCLWSAHVLIVNCLGKVITSLSPAINGFLLYPVFSMVIFPDTR